MNEIIVRADEMLGMAMSFFENGTVLVVTIVIGLILGIFGLKLTRVWAAFIGFLLGIGIGGVIGRAAGLTGMASVGAMLGGAVVLAVLLCLLYKVGIFLFTVFITAGLFAALTGAQNLLLMVIGLAVGIVAAIITMIIFDPLVILVTSICGGILAGSSLTALLGLQENLVVSIILPLVLAAVGCFIQFWMRSRQVGKKQAKQAEEYRKKASREKDVEEARRLLDEDDAEEDMYQGDYDEDFDEDYDEEYDAEELDDIEELDLEEDEDFTILK